MENKELIYKKVGRRYKPVGLCDNEAFYFPKGASLVIVDDGFKSVQHYIDPDKAPILAASKMFVDDVTKLVMEASEAQKPVMLTEEQMDAWQKFVDTGGTSYFTFPSAYSVAEKILTLLINESETINVAEQG